MCALHYRPGIEVVPGYELLALLGRGGFGEVWKAKGPGGVTLAIKVIDKVDDKAGRKEFRALRLIKDINHPNLVTISGFWIKDSDGRLIDPEAITDDSTARGVRPAELIIAMDLGEMTLLDYLERCRKGLLEDQKGGIPADELLEYMEAASKAIDYLNTRHDVQHRDIKPQNILIVGGSAKLCDLGLASTVSSVRTSMGGAGSLAYMAPEVYTSKRPSRATDQYSLAVAYVELRTGRLPLSDCESYSVLDDAKRRGILDLSWLEEPERAVIAKATSLNPDDRYPRCLDMVRALRRACETGSHSARPAETTQVLGDYILERRLHHRTGEEIFEATGPEGHRVLLVARTTADSPDLADGKTLSLVRERSRHQPHLAELYEIVRLSATNRAVPPRLFEGPHPPAFAKLLLVSQCVSRTLADSVTHGGITPGKLMGYLEQMAEVVDFLNEPQHEIGGRRVRLMHSNLRPVNFLIDNDHLYLTNFSAVQALQGDAREFSAGPEIPEGPYTPPEFAGGKLTRWSDQYMLAVAYLQLRTGRPSSGLTGSTQSDRLAGEPRRLDLGELNPAEKEILRRATAANPSQRFATCGEMVRALYGAWNVLVARETPKEVGSEPTQLRPSRSGSAAEAATKLAPRPKFDSTGPTIDLDVVPNRAGTLIAPIGETRLSTDTDREAATAAHERHAAHRTPHAPYIEGKAKLTPVARERELEKPVWKRPAAIGSVLAMLTAAVAAWFLIGNDPNPQPLPDSNAARWFQDNVSPLVVKFDYAAAVDALSGAPPEAPKSDWRDKLQSGWQEHIQGLRTLPPTEKSVADMNAFLTRFESNQDVIAWRAEHLKALCDQGDRELNQKRDQQALESFRTVGRVIDELKKARGRPFDKDDEYSSRANSGRAQAQNRLGGQDKLQRAVADAEQHFKEKRFAKSWAALDDPQLWELVSPIVGPPAYEFVRLSFATLAEWPQSPPEAVDRVLVLLEEGFLDNKGLAPPPNWLVDVATAAQRLATRRGDAATDAKLISRVAGLLTKATTLAKDAGERNRIENLLPELKELTYRRQIDELRRLRDNAGDPPGFAALHEYCKKHSAAGTNDPLLTACKAEAEIMAGTSRSAIKPPSDSDVAKNIADDDRRYIKYVRALCRPEGQVGTAAKELLSAWRGDDPAKPVDMNRGWPVSPLRRRACADTLLRAIKSKEQNTHEGPNMDLRRFDEADAKLVVQWADLALSVAASAADGVVNRVVELTVQRVLAAAYGGAPIDTALAASDALVANENKAVRPAQVLLANIALHEAARQSARDAAGKVRHFRALVGAHARLLGQAREDGRSSLAVIHRNAVGPVIKILDEAADESMNPSDGPLLKAVAAMYAEHGQFVRRVPEVEQQYSSKGPEREALRALKRATKFAPRQCSYHISAAVLAYSICANGDHSALKVLAARVASVAELATTSEEKCALAGLRGLQLAVESVTAGEAKRVEKLEQAVKAFIAADMLKSGCSTEFLQSEDYQRMMLAWGAVYLRLGNFARPEQRRAHLTAGRDLMQRLVDDNSDPVHPERAHGMLGNLQEDFGFRLRDLTGYEKAQTAFEHQFTLAQERNYRERSRAKMNQGRALFRLGNDELNKALGVTVAPGVLPPSSALDQASAQQPKETARTRFNNAQTYLDDAIKLGKDWKGTLAEAYLWKAMLDWHPLRANPNAADESLEKAAAEAEKDVWEWPRYLQLRVEHAVATAQRFATERTIAEAKTWLDRAEASAAILFNRPTDARVAPDLLAGVATSLIQGQLALKNPLKASQVFDQALQLEKLQQTPASRFNLSIGVLKALANHPEVPKRRRYLAGEVELGHKAVAHAQDLLAAATFGQKTTFYAENERICTTWYNWLAMALSQKNEAQIEELTIAILPHLRAAAQLQSDAAWLAGLKQSGQWTQKVEQSFRAWQSQLDECDKRMRARGKSIHTAAP